MKSPIQLIAMLLVGLLAAAKRRYRIRNLATPGFGTSY
jgi:hypothetical protein